MSIKAIVVACVFLSVISPIQAQSTVWQPRPGTTWQWQLQGNINTGHAVQMYDIDLFNTPEDVIAALHAMGRVVICYFSAGSYEDWRPDANDFPAHVLGNALDNWPDEAWLDISNLEALAPIMQARLDLAVVKECDGVEPDNVDGYTNASGFDLTYQDQLHYNLWLADEAHTRALSIGLKNDSDQVEDLVDFFDWSLVEECYEYDECEAYSPFIEAGKAVFAVSYEHTPESVCSTLNDLQFSWLFKSWDLADEPPISCPVLPFYWHPF
jgi:hypothetical protein